MLDPLTPESELGWRLVRAVRAGAVRLEMIPTLPAPNPLPDRLELRSEGGGQTHSESSSNVREDEPAPVDDKLRDQLVTCGHHTSKGLRPLFEHLGRIQVVPSKEELEDTVEIHWRDDYLGSMPAEIHARSGGVEHVVEKTGTSGAYSVYTLEARWDGDPAKYYFFLQSFWTEYNRKTIYSIHGALRNVEVQVFNPRQYKLEISFPPLRKFKTGRHYQRGHQRDPVTGKASLQEHYHKGKETEKARWSPSKLTLSTSTSENGHAATTKTESKKMEPIVFSVDGVKREVDAFTVVGNLIYVIDSIMQIIEKIKKAVPKVGWFFEFELALFQGSAAIEWYWKEYQDHRVFQYVDINVAMTIFKIKLEAGFGIEGLSFKAQVFVEVEGALKVGINGCRDNPSAEYSIGIPLKFEILGAIGARVEAGNTLKASVKGETGFELKLDMGLNRDQRPGWTTEGAIEWLGVKVVMTASASFFGLGGSYTHETELCGPSELSEFRFPDRHAYKPPTVSRNRIKAIFLETIHDGWDLRVEGMSAEAVATTLADKVDANHGWHRTTSLTEGLALSIRADLEGMYEDGGYFGFDRVPVEKFVAYVKGAKLQKHLTALQHPAADLIGAGHH